MKYIFWCLGIVVAIAIGWWLVKAAMFKLLCILAFVAGLAIGSYVTYLIMKARLRVALRE